MFCFDGSLKATWEFCRVRRSWLWVRSFQESLFMEVVELLLSKDVSVIDKNMSFCTLDLD